MSDLLRQNKLAFVGLVIITVLSLTAILAPWLVLYDPAAQQLPDRLTDRRGIIPSGPMSWGGTSSLVCCWVHASACVWERAWCCCPLCLAS